jgi:hypothetical protein
MKKMRGGSIILISSLVMVQSFQPILLQRRHIFQSRRIYRQNSNSFSLHSDVTKQFETSSSNLQQKLQLQTLSRIAIPAITFTCLCYAIFPTAAITIQIWAHDMYDGSSNGNGYETLNLILTDNSNQFIQNIHNFLSLTFAFLAGSTLQFMLRQQDTLYKALFDEVNALISLLEQIGLMSEGRRDLYRTMLQSISTYLENDLKLVTEYKGIHDRERSLTSLSYLMDEMDLSRENLPSLLLSKRPQNDPLEMILYITSVGEPSSIYSSVKELRHARAKRLGALQRKMPEINMYLLYTLGATVFVSFPFVAAGSETVGGDALLQLFRTHLSVGVFAMCTVFGIINELKRPDISSAYSVDYEILGKMLSNVEKELGERMKRCDDFEQEDHVLLETKTDSCSTVLSSTLKEASSSPSKSKVKRLLHKLRCRFRK